MLVLSRKPNQSITIGDEVVVTVLEVRGGQVWLGIRAPREVDVHREEIYVELQKASAVSSTGDDTAGPAELAGKSRAGDR